MPAEPPIILTVHEAAPRPRYGRPLLLAALLFLGFLAVHNAVPLYTDWLWFREVGYTSVFTTTIRAKTLLFFLFGGAFFALLYGNLVIARRQSGEGAGRLIMQRFGPQWGTALQRGIGTVLLVASAFFSLWAGRMGAEQWANYLEFTHGVPFHKFDPVFHNDIGFYVFRLPFLQFLTGFILTTLILTGIAVLALHSADRAVESIAGLPDFKPGVRKQGLALAALFALVEAVSTRLSAYDLLFHDNGGFTGAGYADLHYRLLALNVQTGLLVLTSLLCLAAVWKAGAFRWAIGSAGAWLIALIVLGNLVPAGLQKVVVDPNQFTSEQEYIRRNIAGTREGFGLETVRNVDNFPADESLTAAGLRTNADTLDNIRLWDYAYLAKVYAQTQTVKTYYKFAQTNLDGSQAQNIDIDRYHNGKRLQQVMLGAREIDSAALPGAAQTWQNRRLSYTHGYGIVSSPVNKTTDGLPDYLVQGFPPVSVKQAAGSDARHPNSDTLPAVKRPEIYFGQLTQDYVFVDTAQPEFDYPASDNAGGAGGLQDHYTTYQGKGGIRIGDSGLAKLAFSLRLGDTNVLLAKNFKPETRVMIRRDIRERIQTVAPFVEQDRDPYLVVTDEGRLTWIVDCYTLSDHYPYSTPQSIAVGPLTTIEPSYIRNSIKATVDAYDGSVNLYIADANDPIAKTYADIFPGLLKPMAQMPQGLTAHLRYPEDLFRLQRSVYATYHVNDPRVFYLKEDAWSIPTEPNPDAAAPTAAVPAGTPQAAQMEPYYVIMRLPQQGLPEGEVNREEFLLMSPLSPINREDKNILGWMCARCDPEHYGQLVLYRFPQNASVNGPTQVISLLNSDKTISPQLSLLRQGGSKANFGNLIVIPLNNSLLYVAPLYIESTNANLPQLQKVVVAFGSRVAMENTLDAALARLFPGYGEGQGQDTTPNAPQSNAPPSGPSVGVPPTVRTLIERALTQYSDAQQKLKAGDFAGYGAANKTLEATLNQLRQATSGASLPKTSR